MLLKPRGQLTCTGCSRSIVIGDNWLAEAAKATDGVVTLSDLHRLICKKCGAREPTYDEPIDWLATSDNWYDSGDQRSASADEERDSPFDFYYYDELQTEDGARLEDN